MNRHSDYQPWLHRFALFTALAGLALIALGGLVTSHGVGMAVPDWPNTYGYNMFRFPVSKWVGGIFYEHTHRLLASAVGFLTMTLCGWLWLKEPRRWLRWLGTAALAAVIIQGVLGGLRVVLYKDEIGIFHAALAQLFFILLCLIALYTSNWWRQLAVKIKPVRVSNVLRWCWLATTLLIFSQLLIGATMRHQHAGLAIPDFPLAYGKLWPRMDAAAILSYNQQRVEVENFKDITAFQVGLQMAHRIMALVIFLAVIFCAWSARKNLGKAHLLSKLSLAWVGLIFAQIFLGASTIWLNKAADIATSHVVVGAVSFMAGALLTVISLRVLIPVRAAFIATAPEFDRQAAVVSIVK